MEQDTLCLRQLPELHIKVNWESLDILSGFQLWGGEKRNQFPCRMLDVFVLEMIEFRNLSHHKGNELVWGDLVKFLEMPHNLYDNAC